MLSTVNEQQLDELITRAEIVFVEFWASWCAPCKQFAKVIATVATKNPEIEFVQINVEEEANLADVFQIRSVPHLIVFKNGIAIYSGSGSMPESTLQDLVNQAKVCVVE